MAFRSARLTAELSGQVARLSRRTDELAESRRRLITAADAERSRLERAIAREVLLHLQPLPDRLRQLSSARAGAERPVDPSSLEPLVESLNTALEALREITRGVFPAQLVRSGLPMALTSLLARTGSARRLVVTDLATDRRFDPRVEAAAYFCVVEAVHDLGEPVVVVLDARGRPAAAERERYRPRGPAGRRDAGPRRGGGRLGVGRRGRWARRHRRARAGSVAGVI